MNNSQSQSITFPHTFERTIYLGSCVVVGTKCGTSVRIVADTLSSSPRDIYTDNKNVQEHNIRDNTASTTGHFHVPHEKPASRPLTYSLPPRLKLLCVRNSLCPGNCQLPDFRSANCYGLAPPLTWGIRQSGGGGGGGGAGAVHCLQYS